MVKIGVKLGVPEKGVGITQKYCKYHQFLLGCVFCLGGAIYIYIYIINIFQCIHT